MLPTFVIALREGLEAALIVGIIAAFLKRQGRPDALRSMWVGVGLAVAVCVAVAVVLRIVDNELPQRQQEGLETIVALVAVAMVTYMIVWMTEHARDLKGQLQEQAARGAGRRARPPALVAHGVLRRPARGLRDRGLPARRLQRRGRPGRRPASARARRRRRGRARLRDLPRRRAPQPLALLPRHGRRARARRRRAGRQRRCTPRPRPAGSTAARARRSTSRGSSARARVSGRCSPACSASSPQPTVVEVVGWLLYAIPMLRSSSGPDAVRPRVRARRSPRCGRSVRAPPVVPARRHRCGGARTTRARRSPAAARRRGGPSTWRSPTRAATRRRSKLACRPGHVRGHQHGAVEGHRVRGRSRATASSPRPRTSPPGLTRRFSLDAPARPLHAVLPGRHEHERGTLTVTGDARRGRARARRCSAGVDGYRAYLEEQTDARSVTGVAALRAALAAATSPRRRRATRRRASPTSAIEPVAESFGDLDPRIDARANDVPAVAVDGLPPDRAGALGARNTTQGTAHAGRPASWPTSRELQRLRAHGQARAGSDRATAPSSCSARSRSRRSPARRSATRTPTWSTSRRTSRARTRRSTRSGRALAGQATPTWWPRSSSRFGARRRRAASRTARPTASSPTPQLTSRRCARLSAGDRRAGRAALAGAARALVGVAMAPPVATSACSRPPRAAAHRRRGGRRASRSAAASDDSRRTASADRRDGRRSTARTRPGIATPAQDRLHFAAFDVDDGLRARTCAGLLRTWTAGGRAHDGRAPGGRRQRRAARAAGGHRRGARARAGAADGHLRPRPVAVRRPLRARRRSARRRCATCPRCPATSSTASAAAATSASRRAPTTRRSPSTRCATSRASAAARVVDALVAARLRPDLVDEPRAGHAAQPDGLQGRHEQHQARGRRRAGAARLGRGRPPQRAGVAARRHLPRRPAHPHADRGLGPHVAGRPGADDRPRQGVGRAAGRTSDEFADAEGRPAAAPTATSASRRRRERRRGAPAARLLVHRRHRRPPRPARRRPLLPRPSSATRRRSSRSSDSSAPNDALNEYIKHVGGGVLAIPPGVRRGGYVGEGLFAG